MWELDHKEGWVPKNGCFWTMVLEKSPETPLDNKKIKPVNPKGNEPWIFFIRTDAEAPILWPPDVKSWLTGKDPDAGKDWRQEEKGMTEDEMVGWHHWLDGPEFEQTPGSGEGQGSRACCSSWGRKESDTTEWLNNSYIAGKLFPLWATREAHSNQKNWHDTWRLINKGPRGLFSLGKSETQWLGGTESQGFLWAWCPERSRKLSTDIDSPL